MSTETRLYTADEVIDLLRQQSELRCFTYDQAAELLAIPRNWLEVAACEGSIPSRKFGHYRRFSRDDLIEIIRVHRVGPPQRV